MKTFHFTCGILLCASVRDYLQRLRFQGADIQWFEGSGWIERNWIVKSNSAALLNTIRQTLINAFGFEE